MKKRIVALIGALTLTFAMSLNVFAYGSVNADDVAEEANKQLEEVKDAKVEVAEDAVAVTVGSVTVNLPASPEQLAESGLKASAASVSYRVDKKVTEGTYVSYYNGEDTFTIKDSVDVAVAVAKQLSDASDVESAETLAVAYISYYGSGEATVAFRLDDLGVSYDASKDEIWAVDGSTGNKILGVVENGKVYFTSSEFSPYALVKVTKAAAPAATNRPPYNPLWDPTSPEYAAAHAAAPAPANVVVTAVAPKTGDVVMMVSIMAIIFMAGAAVAVAMSKKRA